LINRVNNVLKDNRKFLPLLLIFAIIIRVWIVQRYYFLGSDDAGYLGLAINLLETGQFSATDGSWPIYPPLYPIFSAAIYYLFGFIIDLPSKLNFVIFSGLLIVPIFLITLSLYNRKEAIIASVLIAIFPTLLLSQQAIWAAAEHIEIFFVWMGIYLLWTALNKIGQTKNSGIIELCFCSTCFALAYLSKPEGLLFLPTGIFILIIFSAFNENIRLMDVVKYILYMLICFAAVASPYWIIQYNTVGVFSLSGKGLSALAYGFIINQGGNIERAIYDGTRTIIETEIDSVGIFNYVLNNKYIFFKHIVTNAERTFSLLFSLIVFPFYYLPFIGVGLFLERWDKKRLLNEIFLFSMFIPMIVNIPFWIGERHLIVFIPIFIIWLSKSIPLLWDWLQLSINNARNKKLIQIACWMIVFVLFLTPFFRYYLVRTKPYAIKNVASWMSQNVPEGQKVYSIKSHYLDLYTSYKYKVGTINYDLTHKELYSQAIEDSYQWLLLEDMLTFRHHPQLKEIFNAKKPPDWLELNYDVTEGGHRAKLYKILFINQ
jgi:hypothetical protein